MKKMLVLAGALILLDQLAKGLAMQFLPGHRLELLPGWGLTYAINKPKSMARSSSHG